jgi:hypothetical protein
MTISGTTPDGVGFTVHGSYAYDADVAAGLLRPRPVKHARPARLQVVEWECSEPGCHQHVSARCADHQVTTVQE